MISDGEFERMLGVFGDAKDQYICIFVPSMTREGKPIDHEFWRNETVRLLSRLFGGATSVNAYGGWLDEEMGGQVKEEDVSLVAAFFSQSDLTDKAFLALRAFLHGMGRDAQQGEIGVRLNKKFIRIREFDHA